jgi:hypothetical protein
MILQHAGTTFQHSYLRTLLGVYQEYLGRTILAEDIRSIVEPSQWNYPQELNLTVVTFYLNIKNL